MMEIEDDSTDYGRGERMVHFTGEYSQSVLETQVNLKDWQIEGIHPESDFRGMTNPGSVYLKKISKE